MTIKRIAVVGNSGGGKTLLSKNLAAIYNLPVTHVDSIQFSVDLKIKPFQETIRVLDAIHQQEKWIIDGYGPLDIIEKRFELADQIVFIDFPLWQHYLWCVHRQIKSLWAPRLELPEGADELKIPHMLKLYKTMWGIHKKMRPELLKIFSRPNLKNKMIFIRSKKEWTAILKNGFTTP